MDPVQPLGKEIPKIVEIVGAISRIYTFLSVCPCGIFPPKKIKGTCVSYE